MKPQFVTAIYTGLEGTRFNGNAFGIYERYKQSLKSLADGGYSIVCYTSAAHYDELAAYYVENPNLTLVVEELSENYFHQQIEAVKDKHPKYVTEDAWRSRCVEIMWGKFYWLWKNTMNLEPEDSLFWIDAGLFHGGLLTNEFRSEKSKGFHDFDKITQERDLFADLVKYANEKIVNIRSEIVNHGSEDYNAVFGSRPQYGVVGGVFGGKRDALLKYICDATGLMQLVIDHEILLKEEEIMYHLHERNPELFSDFYFRTWYNKDWNMVYDDGIRVSFSDFFEAIRK